MGVVQFGIVIDFELLLAPSGGVCDVELKQNVNKKRLQKKWWERELRNSVEERRIGNS